MEMSGAEPCSTDGRATTPRTILLDCRGTMLVDGRGYFKSLFTGISGREMLEWQKMSAPPVGAGYPDHNHRLNAAQFSDGFGAMRSGVSGKVVMTWPPEVPGADAAAAHVPAAVGV